MRQVINKINEVDVNNLSGRQHFMSLYDRLDAALTTADTTRTRLLEALLHETLEPATDTLEAAE